MGKRDRAEGDLWPEICLAYSMVERTRKWTGVIHNTLTQIPNLWSFPAIF
jgi:hypothetical protein